MAVAVSLVLALAAIAAVISLVGALRGERRARVSADGTPEMLCARCGYTVRDESTLCTECGGSLTQEGARVRTRRVRTRGSIAFAAALVAIAVAGATLSIPKSIGSAPDGDAIILSFLELSHPGMSLDAGEHAGNGRSAGEAELRGIELREIENLELLGRPSATPCSDDAMMALFADPRFEEHLAAYLFRTIRAPATNVLAQESPSAVGAVGDASLYETDAFRRRVAIDPPRSDESLEARSPAPMTSLEERLDPKEFRRLAAVHAVLARAEFKIFLENSSRVDVILHQMFAKWMPFEVSAIDLGDGTAALFVSCGDPYAVRPVRMRFEGKVLELRGADGVSRREEIPSMHVVDGSEARLSNPVLYAGRVPLSDLGIDPAALSSERRVAFPADGRVRIECVLSATASRNRDGVARPLVIRPTQILAARAHAIDAAAVRARIEQIFAGAVYDASESSLRLETLPDARAVIRTQSGTIVFTLEGVFVPPSFEYRVGRRWDAREVWSAQRSSGLSAFILRPFSAGHLSMAELKAEDARFSVEVGGPANAIAGLLDLFHRGGVGLYFGELPHGWILEGSDLGKKFVTPLPALPGVLVEKVDVPLPIRFIEEGTP